MNQNLFELLDELYSQFKEMQDFVEVEFENTEIYFEVRQLLRDNLNNVAFVAKCMLRFPELYEFLPYDIRCIEEVSVEALAFHKPNFSLLPEELKASQSFKAELFFKSPFGHQLDFNFIAEDGVLIYRLLERIAVSEYYFKYAPEVLVTDRTFCKKALEKNGMVLHFLPLEFREDEELTRIALSECGIALKYAHQKFQSDLTMVLIAVEQNISSIRYAHPSVFEARELEFIWELPEWISFKKTEIEHWRKGYSKFLGAWTK